MWCRFYFVLIAVLLGTAPGCQRAPAEDFAPRGYTSSSEAPRNQAPPREQASSATAATPTATPTAASSLAGRCVLATPSVPPPDVALGPAAGCPDDPEGGPPKVPVVTVAIEGTGVSVQAERVSSEHDTMRGLMYRPSLAEDRGMLFYLGSREDHKFWMHNTCIPLDLLFVDDDGLIVGIVENAPTLDDAPRGVGCPSRWVLEVNAGWSRRHGVRAGQRLKLPAAP